MFVKWWFTVCDAGPAFSQNWGNVPYVCRVDRLRSIDINIFAVMQGGGPRVVVSTAAFHARVRGSVPGLGGLKETKLFLPHPRVKVSIVGSLRDREVACSASDRQGLNFESCVWRTVSSQSSHHPQKVLLAQFSLYVHKGGLKPDSFHLFAVMHLIVWSRNSDLEGQREYQLICQVSSYCILPLHCSIQQLWRVWCLRISWPRS